MQPSEEIWLRPKASPTGCRPVTGTSGCPVGDTSNRMMSPSPPAAPRHSRWRTRVCSTASFPLLGCSDPPSTPLPAASPARWWVARLYPPQTKSSTAPPPPSKYPGPTPPPELPAGGLTAMLGGCSMRKSCFSLALSAGKGI